ncbi:hypothetical protein [Streptomyces sp. NPDC053079]|uniref:hypothetical protein n=1 Tax=Streptomyces sp. NPDC053079 TaxID=3365697 RepID=UPI0037D89AD1
MSHNQPGPYGPPPIPPQQPNPYSQGFDQGYPQQPAPGGWGQPQAPGPYAQYPPPVPPQGGGKGKAIGITIGALVVVGAIVGGVLFFTGGSDSGSGGGGDAGGDGVPAKMAPYTIEMPQTLLDGKYTKSSTSSSKDSEDLSNDAKAKEFGIANGTGKKGSYTNSEKQRLKVTAVYGDLADPAKTVDALFADMEKSQAKYKDRIETVSETAAYRPLGFDGVSLKCKTQRVKSSLSSSTATDVSTCIWGDASAMGIVEHRVTKGSGSSSEATGEVMSAKDLSEATAKVRNEVRKPK